MQRLLAILLVVAGLSLAGWVALDPTGDDVGSVTVGSEAEPEATVTPATSATPAPAATETPTPEPTSPSPAASPTVALPEVTVSSAGIDDVDLSSPPAPTRVTLPSIGVDTSIVPVGVDPDGSMTIPEDVATVGWYRYGSAPGSDSGTIVLSGHVDSRTQGRGAFFDLRIMEVGDEVTVADEDGRETTWRITGRRTFEKESLPIEELFRRDGAPRLVLITCGGDFDSAARSYDSNVVVEAEPIT